MSLRRPGVLGGVALVAVAIAVGVVLGGDEPALDGRDEREPVSHRATIQAAFQAESYSAGGIATLRLYDRARTVEMQIFRVGDADGPLAARDAMRGEAVGSIRRLRRVAPGKLVTFRLDPSWSSGLYYAELKAPGDRVGYAPFVLAPTKLGGHRIAVVLPTETWQAYNFRDDDGDGKSDTWYADPEHLYEARLIRPFENRGVPPHYRLYDEPFLRWLARNGYEVDTISDAELRRARGDTLARAYDLMVFEGHHEYVTERELDAVTQYRDLGGNLIFLSANNFFRKITIAKGVMTLVGQFRKLGRPEATLLGNRYFGSSPRGGGAWVVRESAAADWLFRYTGLEPGSTFAQGGIEADSTSPASPPGTEVVAEIPDVFGDGRAAEMTYYEDPSGARVFSAGAFTLAGSVWQPTVSQVMINLLEELGKPADLAEVAPAKH